MKARIERDELRRALRTVLPAVGRGSLAVLNGVHVDATDEGLRLTATDLQLTITAQVSAEVSEPGVLVAPARLLAAFVDKAPAGAIGLGLDDHDVTVDAGDSTARVRALPADEWPRIHPADGDPVTLTSTHVDLIRRILPFAGTDDTRPVLTGLFVSGATAATTDSYRLGEAHLDGADLPTAVIPVAAVTAALKGADDEVELTVGGRHATFTHGGSSWTTVLIEGDFPDYGKLLRRTSPHSLTFNAQRLADALGRVGVVGGPLDTNGNRPPVRIERDGDKAVVYQNAQDVGRIDDVVPCDGDFDGAFGLNPQFLADLIAAADSEDVTLGLVDSLKPVECIVDDLMLLLMPTRLA